MSKTDIRFKIEKVLSDILSDKYDAKIKIKFAEESNTNVNEDTTGNF